VTAHQALELLRSSGINPSGGPVIWQTEGREFEGLVWHDGHRNEWSCRPISEATTRQGVLDWAIGQLTIQREQVATDVGFDANTEIGEQAKVVAYYDGLIERLEKAK
jgi:hypothetical protein